VIVPELDGTQLERVMKYAVNESSLDQVPL